VAKFKGGHWGSFHREPQPGDLVFYSFGGKRPDHVGMVEAVGPSGTFTTIEGNVGDACRRQRKSLKTPGLLGFGRPRYTGVSTPKKTEARRTLALGASGADVRDLQTVLVGAGHLTAADVDGEFGKDTKAAVIKLQAALRVTADGIVGPVTHAAIDSLLRFLAAAAGEDRPRPRREDLPLLRRDATGDVVKLAQTRLRSHGFDPGPIDGVFGADTERAVRAFQAARGLEVDGEVGPFTWGALG
jgi:peptidoglycan hydrolase-like protein with peptidoglycan-binding domain